MKQNKSSSTTTNNYNGYCETAKENEVQKNWKLLDVVEAAAARTETDRAAKRQLENQPIRLKKPNPKYSECTSITAIELIGMALNQLLCNKLCVSVCDDTFIANHISFGRFYVNACNNERVPAQRRAEQTMA